MCERERPPKYTSRSLGLRSLMVLWVEPRARKISLGLRNVAHLFALNGSVRQARSIRFHSRTAGLRSCAVFEMCSRCWLEPPAARD